MLSTLWFLWVLVRLERAGGAGVQIRGLSGAGRQCWPLTCPVLPAAWNWLQRRGAGGVSPDPPGERAGPAPLQRALGSGELGLRVPLALGVQVPAVPATSQCRQSGAPSPRAQCLGRSRGAVSGQGALVGFPESILRVLAELLLSGSVCGHGRVFGCGCLVLVSVIRFLSILWFSLSRSLSPPPGVSAPLSTSVSLNFLSQLPGSLSFIYSFSHFSPPPIPGFVL